jgi:hypothetical protein
VGKDGASPFRGGKADSLGTKKSRNFLASPVYTCHRHESPSNLLPIALFLIPATHAENVKDSLNHQYKSQILALRSPFTAGDQKFDCAGHSLTAAPNSGWLIYGGIYVERLNLSSDTLRLEGPRAAFTGEKKKGKPVLVRFSKSVRVEIHLNHSLKSLDDAEAVLGRVFFLGADTAEHSRPEFRRADDTTSDDQIYSYRERGVTAPKPTFTPEPDFSEEARREKFQGSVILSIVVDKTETSPESDWKKSWVTDWMNTRWKQSKPGALRLEPGTANLWP